MKRPEQSGSGQTASGRFANLLLDDPNRENQIAGTDVVDHIHPFDHTTETGMYAVQMLRIFTVHADKELRAARILAPMGHREHTRTIGIDTDAVSVKATTTERLGFEGREEGVSVAAVALIYRE